MPKTCTAFGITLAPVGEEFQSNLLSMAALKHVFVTGGNDGIGLALCKLLVTQKGCFVYMGSRSVERGHFKNPSTLSSIIFLHNISSRDS